MPDVKVGDRIKVTVEGVVKEFDAHDVCVKIVDGEDYNHYIFMGSDTGATVEVIEPEYEHNQFYRDAHNETFRYSTANGDKPWRKVDAGAFPGSVPFDYPVRPLRKLVPES